MVLIEIRSVPAERSRGRHNPRVVKRKMSGFPTRSRAAPAWGGRFCYNEHIKVLPPAVPQAVEPASETPEKAASLLRSVNQLGNLNILVTGAILGITTVLSMKATESVRFSAVSRLLP